MTHPTGDALVAHEKVVEAVAKAIGGVVGVSPFSAVTPLMETASRAAIAAYQHAMKEQG
jgi:hypothetical protein